MELRHARTFVTVAEVGTVSGAARRLHVAQPALSRQIVEFEEELGIALFDRIGRRLVLTSAGEQLLADCRALLACAAALKEHALALRGGDRGVLRIAASPQIIEGALAGFLPHYARAFPGVEVKLVEAMGWGDVVGLLERGDIHLGLNLVGAVPPDDLRFAEHRLEAIDLLAACHPAHAIGSVNTIDIAQLAGEPLLVLDASYVFRRKFDAACRLAGVVPKVAYESRTPHTLLAMAENGHGVAIIPSGLRTDRHDLRIAALTYRAKPLREYLTMYRDRRRTLPPHAIAFCDQLAAYMREVFPVSRPSTPRQIGLRGKNVPRG